MVIKNSKQNLILVFVLFFTILFAEFALAITASSPSYSTSMFGTGSQTATPESTSYESTTLLTSAQSSTSSASSSSYTSNIGFYDNSAPYSVPIVNSYSILPIYSDSGAIVRLSIYASGVQSVWADVTRPDGVKETVILANNGRVYYESASVLGTYSIIFYASNSNGVVTAISTSFVITQRASTTTTPTGTTTTGGSESIDKADSYSFTDSELEAGVGGNFNSGDLLKLKIITSGSDLEGSYNIRISEIKPSSIKLIISPNPKTLNMIVGESKDIDLDGDGITDLSINLNEVIDNKARLNLQKAGGVRKGITGGAIAQKPYLFDVIVEIPEKYQTIGLGENLLAKITIYNMGTEEVLDALIRYYVRDSEDKEVYRVSETVAVYTKVDLLKELELPATLGTGKYFLKAEVIYGANETAIGRAQFYIVDEELAQKKSDLFRYFVYFVIIGLILFLIRCVTKSSKSGDRPCIFSRFIGGIMGAFSRTESAINATCGILSRVVDKRAILSRIIGKKVCTESGEEIGEVIEVILGENKIESLKVKLNKGLRKMLDIEGIIVKYKNVIGVRDIVLINDEVLSERNIKRVFNRDDKVKEE